MYTKHANRHILCARLLVTLQQKHKTCCTQYSTEHTLLSTISVKRDQIEMSIVQENERIYHPHDFMRLLSVQRASNLASNFQFPLISPADIKSN